MSQPALYRRYRPRSFKDVVGQPRVIGTLQEAVRQRRLSHAYLFSGPRGTGKTSVARILAKAVNCAALTPDGNPCLDCEACRAIETGQHLDVMEIDAASNRGIDEIREIKERIAHRPAMGSMKIYIVDEVHMLTDPAFNALLKTLEEPPPHVLFILATTEPQKLPITVLSRCQRYEFQRLGVPLIQSRLEDVCRRENVSADAEALELIAEFADGAMRDALSLLDQVIATGEGVQRAEVAELVGATDRVLLEQLLVALAKEGVPEVVTTLDQAAQGGRDYRLLLRDVARQLRDVLVYRQVAPDFFPPYRRQWLLRLHQQLPEHIGTDQWYAALDALAEAEGRLRGGFPPELVVELAFFKVRDALQAGSALGRATVPPVAPERQESAVPVAGKPDSAGPKPAIKLPPADTAASQKSPPKEADGDVGRLLEWVRRERPTTHALLQDARVDAIGPGQVRIVVQYPAHQRLLAEDKNHRDVLHKAIKFVFGADTQFQVVAQGQESPGAGMTAEAMKEAVRDWFGDEVRLVGFDEQ
ncbi:MAG: DNA polymerase III subunit gamma/tau [Thermaerobacter sp.]|nr:DNA polymerase III subunit gamma/tau [Thermaerobacter sp.]